MRSTWAARLAYVCSLVIRTRAASPIDSARCGVSAAALAALTGEHARYLLERRLWVVRRETLAGPYGPELHRFEAAAKALDYGRRTCVGSASGVVARLLIQTGRPLEARRARGD